MITPKEKANDLLSKMWMSSSTIEDAVECALIAVDELQKNAHNNYMGDYWQQVKNEIEKL